MANHFLPMADIHPLILFISWEMYFFPQVFRIIMPVTDNPVNPCSIKGKRAAAYHESHHFMKEKLVLFWQSYGPPFEAVGIILLLIGNTYMKHSAAFKGIAIAYWIICLALYIMTAQTYRKMRFWLFLVLGLILAVNQLFQLIDLVR